MEKHIYNYLTQNYYIRLSDVGNHGIYLINDDRRFHTPVNGNKLITELITVFAVESEEAALFIHKWSVEKYGKVDLEFYWKTNDDIFFGNIGNIVRNVSAVTLSQSLVPVQPMAFPEPKGTLFYLDTIYVSENNTIKNKVVTLFKNIYNRIFGIFKN
jgi:hypothetical protein